MAMKINPLTFYIEALRDLVVLGQLPEWQSCLVAAVVALAVFLVGFSFFQRVRPGFADVL
jgi:lipopolysaccharide transport system permease protein